MCKQDFDKRESTTMKIWVKFCGYWISRIVERKNENLQNKRGKEYFFLIKQNLKIKTK